MPDFTKLYTFLFKESGNNCGVLVNFETLSDYGTRSIRIEWDFHPPSPREYKTWARK